MLFEGYLLRDLLVRIWHPPGWPSEKPKRKKRRQECCSYCENCTSIGMSLARLRAVRTSEKEWSIGETRGEKFWDQFDGYDSHSSTLRQASIRENKGPSLGKVPVKNPHQRSPYAVKFEDRSEEETEAQRKKTRLHSSLPRRNGSSQLRQQKSRRKAGL